MSSLLLRAKKLSKNINIKNRQIIYKEVYNRSEKEHVMTCFLNDHSQTDELLIIVNAYEWNENP